jgi:hypothetical protein
MNDTHKARGGLIADVCSRISEIWVVATPWCSMYFESAPTAHVQFGQTGVNRTAST